MHCLKLQRLRRLRRGTNVAVTVARCCKFQDSQQLEELMTLSKVGQPFRLRSHLIRLAGLGCLRLLCNFFALSIPQPVFCWHAGSLEISEVLSISGDAERASQLMDVKIDKLKEALRHE